VPEAKQPLRLKWGKWIPWAAAAIFAVVALVLGLYCDFLSRSNFDLQDRVNTLEAIKFSGLESEHPTPAPPTPAKPDPFSDLPKITQILDGGMLSASDGSMWKTTTKPGFMGWQVGDRIEDFGTNETGTALLNRTKGRAALCTRLRPPKPASAKTEQF